jgi:hypothetical protein
MPDDKLDVPRLKPVGEERITEDLAGISSEVCRDACGKERETYQCTAVETSDDRSLPGGERFGNQNIDSNAVITDSLVDCLNDIDIGEFFVDACAVYQGHNDGMTRKTDREN